MGTEAKKLKLDAVDEDAKNGQNNYSTAVAFLERIFQKVMKEGIKQQLDRNGKVLDFHQPEELSSLLNLELPEKGCSEDELLKLCEPIMKYSIKTGHPHFFNTFYQGLDRYAVAGSWLTAILNTSQYTFELAPVFTLMEDVVFKKFRNYVGWDQGDGIFTPGGSFANLYGLNLARFSKFPEVKTKGMQCLPRICLFTSEHSHYSWKKGASFMGIGVDNVVIVRCDKEGRMIPSELESLVLKAKQEGMLPFFVNGTSGTTVYGAFDPLDEIADICKKYQMWLHIDACWGGAALLSQKYCYKLKGIHKADSIAYDPHKMMGTLQQTSIFLTKHEGLLKGAHCANASYLFQPDKIYDVSFDTGDKSLQCSRKVDVLKVWMMWKAYGSLGFENRINHFFDLAAYFTECIKSSEGFRMVVEPECTNVCFWYIPPSLRGQEETDEWWEKLGKVAPHIKGCMQKQGTTMISYQPSFGQVNFFRFVICNPDCTEEDMDFAINEVIRLGKDL